MGAIQTQIKKPRIAPAPVRTGAVDPRDGRVPQFLRATLWAGLAFVAAIALAEAIFLLAHIGEEEYLKLDPIVAFSHLERKRITFRSEGFSNDKINSAGFRDSEHTLMKPVGVKRIALLGDSRTEAFQVPLEKTFGKLLEQKLNANGAKFEVMNFGISSFGTGQEYLQYLTTVRNYKPDIVCVVYNVLDSDENVLPYGDPNPTPRPYFLLTKDNKLLIDRSALESWWIGEKSNVFHSADWLRRNSRIWGVFAMMEIQLNADKHFVRLKKFCQPVTNWFAHVTAPANRQPCKAPDLVQVDPLAAQPVPESNIKSIKVTATDSNARMLQAMTVANDNNLRVTEAIFHRLNEACKRDNAKLAIVTMPAPNNSFFYFRELERLEMLAKRGSMPFINLHPHFPSVGPMEPSPYLYAKAHLSLIGNRVAANKIYEGLLPLTTK